MSEKKYRDGDWFRQKYHGEELLVSEIAEEQNVSIPTITRWRKKHDIEARSEKETQRLLVDKRLRDEKWMEQKYIEEEKNISKISEICSVGRGTVFRWLNRHDIETRNSGKNQFIDYETLDDEEFLYEKYVEENCTLKDIAEICNCSVTLVSEYLSEYNIEVDHRGSVSGKRNHNYQNGDYKQNRMYGENWEEKREEIIKRDDEKCQSCGMIRQRCRSKFNKDLSVHHITPRRQFCEDDSSINFDEANREENLITFCSECHSRFEMKSIPQEEYEGYSRKVKEKGDWPELFINNNDNIEYCKI